MRKDPRLIEAVATALGEIRARGVKRSHEYKVLKAALTPHYRPFDIFAAYQYLAGSTRGDWDASIRLAAYVARRR